MSEPDVIVVGAGPAGSVTAALLARRGFHVVLLDRAVFPRDKTCAEYLSPGVIDIANRLGIASRLREAGAHATPGMEIISPSGATLPVQYTVHGRSAWAATLSRRVLDEVLLENAVHCGADFRERVTVREPLLHNGAVVGVAGSSDGKRQEFRAALTVVADGNRSTLARSLGLSGPARWPMRLGLVAHFEGRARLRGNFGQMHVSRSGYCGVAPLSGNRFNVAVVAKADALKKSTSTATQFFDAWIERTPALHQLLADCTRITPVRGIGPIGSRSRRVSTSGAMLVGDAAGFFDPFTGEGIFRAMRSAELATDVASEALVRSDVSRSSLQAYDRSRSREFRTKQAVTTLVQLFVQFPALMEYALPRLEHRPDPLQRLGAVLGDCQDPKSFLNTRTLWSALRP